jgi:hypothetical protein
MKVLNNWLSLTLAAGVSLWLAGCTPSAPPSSSGGSGTTDGHEHEHEHGHQGHDHAHDHAHHGPHGGDIMVIGDEEYHAEWTHENGTVTFYILDSDAKKEVPIPAEKITVDVKINDGEPTTYELLAVNPSGDEMKSAQFEIVDTNLEGALEALSKGVVATLHVEIDGKSFNQKIEKEAHDHAHDHGEAKPVDKPTEDKPAEEKPAESQPE